MKTGQPPSSSPSYLRGLNHELLGPLRHVAPRSPEGENAAKARRLAVGHRPQKPRLGVARSGKAETLAREIE